MRAQGFGSNTTLIASVYAIDAFGAASRATFGVAVSAYEGGVEDLSDLVDDVASEALAAGDTDTVMQVPCAVPRRSRSSSRPYIIVACTKFVELQACDMTLGCLMLCFPRCCQANVVVCRHD